MLLVAATVPLAALHARRLSTAHHRRRARLLDLPKKRTVLAQNDYALDQGQTILDSRLDSAPTGKQAASDACTARCGLGGALP